MKKFKISYVTYAILSVIIILIAIGAYVGLYYALDSYIDKKINNAITRVEVVTINQNVHDVITANDVLNKNGESYTVVVRSKQTYDECRISPSESMQAIYAIRDCMSNDTVDLVKAGEYGIKSVSDNIKVIANKYNIKVYDILFKSEKNQAVVYAHYAEE